MGTTIGYIIIGFLGSLIAGALMPYKPNSFSTTVMRIWGISTIVWVSCTVISLLSLTIVGIFGALLGTFLGGLIFNISYSNLLTPVGLIMGLIFSILGTLLILVIKDFLISRILGFLVKRK